MLWAWATLKNVYPAQQTIAGWAGAKHRRTAMRHLKWFEDRGFFTGIRNYFQTIIYKPNKLIINDKFLMSLDGLFSGLNQWISKTVTLLNSYSKDLLNLFVYSEVKVVFSLAPAPRKTLYVTNEPPWDP